MKLVISLLVIFVLAACAPAPASPTVQPADTATLSPPASTSTPLSSLPPTIAPTPTATPSYFVRDGAPVPQPAEAISPDNVGQIAELARWGYGAIEEVVFANNGEIMLVQTSIAVYAYPAGTLDELWRYEPPEGVSSFAVADSQNLVALGTYTGKIYLIDLLTGDFIKSWQAHSVFITDIALTRDGSMIASSATDYETIIWDVTQIRRLIEFSTEFTYQEYVEELFFSNQDQWLAMRVWNWIDGDEYIFLDLSANELSNQIIKADYIFAIEPKHNIYGDYKEVRNLITGEVISELEQDEQSSELFTLTGAFSSDGSLYAMGDASGAVAVWQAVDGRLLSILDPDEQAVSSLLRAKPAKRSGPGPSQITSIDISADNKSLIATNGFGTVFLWNLDTLELERTFTGKGRESIFSPDGQSFVSMRQDILDMYDIREAAIIEFIPGDWRGSDVVFSPEGTRLASGNRLWVVETGEQLNTARGEQILGFSSNGNYLYVIAPQWWVRERRTQDLELQRQAELRFPVLDDEYWDEYVPGQWWELNDWLISPDSTLIHAWAFELPILGWRISDGGFQTYNAGSTISAITYSPDSEYFVAYGYAQRNLQIFKKTSSNQTEELHSIKMQQAVNELSVSADSTYLYIAGENGIEVYHLASGVSEGFIFNEEDVFVYAVGASPITSIIAAATSDEFLFFDLKSKDLIHSISHSFGRDVQLTFSPDGHYLATASSDGTVRLWGIPPN